MTTLFLSCSKIDQPENITQTQNFSIEQQLYLSRQIKIPYFNNPLLTKVQNEISVTPEWNKLRKIRGGKNSVIPLKMSKTIFFKTSKNEFKKLKLKAFMIIKNKVATKSGGDDDGYVVMTNDDDGEEGSGDDGGTAPGGNTTDIQFVSISTLNGSLLYAMIFVNGYLEYLIMPSSVPMIDPNFEADPNFSVWLSTNDQNFWYLTIDTGAYCVAYKTSSSPNIPIRDIINFNQDGGDENENEKPSNPIDYEVSPPDDPGGDPPVNFGFQITLNVSPANSGVTIGSGYYPTFIVKTLIKAIPNSAYKFSNWSGDFTGMPQEFEYNNLVTQNITATANFVRIPCRDNISGDPLINMEILGSKANGIAGGRYGNGRGRDHNGIDLNAPIGTPIYAAFDGEVVKIVSCYDQNMQWGDYRKIYGNQSSLLYSAGNQVRIRSVINGEIVYHKYFHMDDVYVSGGEVKAGTIIGTVGTTGSACSPESNGSHLHFEIHINSLRNPVNPETYFYTKFNSSGTKINSCND